MSWLLVDLDYSEEWRASLFLLCKRFNSSGIYSIVGHLSGSFDVKWKKWNEEVVHQCGKTVPSLNWGGHILVTSPLPTRVERTNEFIVSNDKRTTFLEGNIRSFIESFLLPNPNFSGSFCDRRTNLSVSLQNLSEVKSKILYQGINFRPGTHKQFVTEVGHFLRLNVVRILLLYFYFINLIFTCKWIKFLEISFYFNSISLIWLQNYINYILNIKMKLLKIIFSA